MRDVRISSPEMLSSTLDIAQSRGSFILSVIHLHRPHPTVCFQTFDKDGSGTIDEVNLVGELAQRLARDHQQTQPVQGSGLFGALVG